MHIKENVSMCILKVKCGLFLYTYKDLCILSVLSHMVKVIEIRCGKYYDCKLKCILLSPNNIERCITPVTEHTDRPLVVLLTSVSTRSVERTDSVSPAKEAPKKTKTA